MTLPLTQIEVEYLRAFLEAEILDINNHSNTKDIFKGILKRMTIMNEISISEGDLCGKS